MDPAVVEKRFREWKELLDCGWRFCLEVFPQLYPGCDPMQKLREAYDAKGREHLAANERIAAALGRWNSGRIRLTPSRILPAGRDAAGSPDELPPSCRASS